MKSRKADRSIRGLDGHERKRVGKVSIRRP
jgi:hypothetical protein